MFGAFLDVSRKKKIVLSGENKFSLGDEIVHSWSPFKYRSCAGIYKCISFHQGKVKPLKQNPFRFCISID